MLLLSGVGQPSVHFQEFITLLLNLELASTLIQSENCIPWGNPGMHFGEIANQPVSRTPALGDGQWAQETP